MNALIPLSDLAASFRAALSRVDINAVAKRFLLAGAAATAGCLMLAYVQVCRESVQKGDRWRAEQRALSSPGAVVNHRSGHS